MADGAAVSTLLDVDTSDNITTELVLTMASTQKSLLDSCPIWTDPDRELLYAFSFWVEGVSQGLRLSLSLSLSSVAIFNCKMVQLCYKLPKFAFFLYSPDGL